jgi:hypothetical protein
MTKETAFEQAMGLLIAAEELTGPIAMQMRLLDGIAKAIFEAHNTSHRSGYAEGYIDCESGYAKKF